MDGADVQGGQDDPDDPDVPGLSTCLDPFRLAWRSSWEELIVRAR